MTNLAISDFTVIFVLPFKVYSYQSPWKLGTHLCSFLVAVHYLNTYVSIYTVTVIAVDRYIALKYPFKAKVIRSPLKAMMVCIMIWIFIGSLGSCVFFFTIRKLGNATEQHCFQKSSSEPWSLTLLFTLEILGFLIPLVILIFCSAEIIYILKKKKISQFRQEKNIQQVSSIIATNIIVFIICFLPLHVGFLVRNVIESTSGSCTVLLNAVKAIHFSSCVANTNCCFDAICYYFVAQEFWEATPLLSRQQNDSGLNTQNSLKLGVVDDLQNHTEDEESAS
ncbi:G-protein coupled receptor 35-like [Latimeria chalumnae]|uniref:G-protein coupled receptor 35-like n=1 Tax=Latimeria chalumnae TaxID=7897 RepID=UPI0006D9403B|nr:PREDICTED: G-protein coupled receptor 35-like [Latimeria chalumnae]|eukprot:XP_006014541.2 PREDICTED: G-protein coupled receptor 35-like [Latimeria chalumnae]